MKRTPARVSDSRRLRPEVSKNVSAAPASNDWDPTTSTTTSASSTASRSPSPVMVSIPVLGDAGTTWWPAPRRMATALDPIRPVPPTTTIFMRLPPRSRPTLSATAVLRERTSVLAAANRLQGAASGHPRRCGPSRAGSTGIRRAS